MILKSTIVDDSFDIVAAIFAIGIVDATLNISFVAVVDIVKAVFVGTSASIVATADVDLAQFCRT